MIGPAPSGAPPGPERGEGPATTPGPRSSALDGGDTQEVTSDHRQLPDARPAKEIAAGLLAHFGDRHEALRHAGKVLVALGVTMTVPNERMMTRVRWRAPWWRAEAKPSSRFFSQATAAEKFAQRRRNAGHEVEVAMCVAGPWVATEVASFTPRTMLRIGDDS